MADTSQQASTSQTQTANATSEGGQSTQGPSLAEFQAMEKELRSAKGELSKTSETVGKLRQAFVPEEATVDPDEAFLDTYLQAAVDAEKAGHPIPLTTNLAVKLTEANKRNQELQARLDKLEGKMADAEDPGVVADRRAYESIDSIIGQQLTEVYGEGSYPDKLFTSTAAMIIDEIKRLKVEAPQAWDAIKRDPRNQAKMVRHFVEKNIPSRAKEAMQREYMSNYKMSAGELMQAFREANELEDPRAKAKIKESIRQQLLSTIWTNKKDQSLISKLYRGG